MVFTPEGVLYAVIFSMILFLFILIPYILELRKAYDLTRKRDEKAQDLLKSSVTEFMTSMKAQNSPLNDEQLDRLYDRIFTPVQEILTQPVTAVTGSTRGIIAFAIIFTVGVSVMLIMFAKGGDPQIVNNIITMLGATLATIVGFYFGGRTVLDSMDRADRADRAAEKRKTTKAPSSASVDSGVKT